MNNNRLYHRQCYRHHEQRASSAAVNDVSLPSADNDDTMAEMITDNDKPASNGDKPSVSVTSKTVCSSASLQAPLAASSLAASSLPSCELSSVVAGEQTSPKPLTDSQPNAASTTAPESVSQVTIAVVNVSAQDISASTRQKTDSSVSHHSDADVSQPAAAAVNAEAVSTRELTSVEEELVRGLPCSVGEDTASRSKTTANDVSEQLQNKVESERTEKLVLGKPAEAPCAPSSEGASSSSSSSFVTAAATEHVVSTSNETQQLQNESSKKTVPSKPAETVYAASLVSESMSSSPSFGAATTAEHVIVSTTKEAVVSSQTPVSPRSCQQAPADVSETTEQQTNHSRAVNISRTVSRSSDRQPRAPPLPCGTITTSAHVASNTTATATCTAAVSAASESSSKAVHHAVKDSHRLVARRPAPPPPTQTQQTTAGSQQLKPVVQTTTSSRTVPEAPIKSSRDVTSADQQSLRPDVQAEHLSSKEAVSTQSEEQTAAVSIQGQSSPVPTPRHSRLPKIHVLTTDAEMCQAGSSVRESAVVTKAATDKGAQPRKASPVPKPRKNLHSVVEPGEVSGRGKEDVVVKHGDMERSQGDASLALKSKTDDIVTGSSMSDAADKEPRKQMPTARPRTPDTMLASSSLMPGEENNISPSLSPTVPVKFPRSKKRTAAPLPPRPPRPVSPNVPSPKPESSSITEPEPQARVPPQRPDPPAGMSSQVSNNSSDRSPTVNSENSTSTANSEPVRRKITPGVKFTFEKDVFRPPKPAGAVDSSSSAGECLKPSRPAPPRPTVVAVAKRKVLHACSLYQ